jgi:predicted nucleic acid-binding protein
MDNILLDSDVILDFYFDRKPFSDHTTQVLGLCETNKVNGFMTPVIYSNVYYLLRQTAKHEKVIDNLKLLISITNVLSMDKEVVLNALNSEFKDFEDGLQYFAALSAAAEINVILTRNTKDYKKSKISVLTPESYIKSFNARS